MAGAEPHDEALRQEAIVWLTRLQSQAEPDCHQAFEDWYSADPQHADTFDSVQSSWDRMDLAKSTLAATRDRVSSGADIVPKHRARRWPVAVAAGFAALLVAMSALGIHHMAGSWSHDAQQQTLVSHVGEIRTVALADGSHVTLDTNSLVSVDLGDKERRVVLGQGRARFEVAHDPARPFVVQAGTHLVIAHGTVFDVDLRGGTMTVSLLRGSIEVRRQPALGLKKPGKGQMLVPGQQLSFGQGPWEAAPVAFSAEGNAWPSGMLSFTNSSMGEVVDTANRYNAQHILVADPDLAALRVTVTTPARDIGRLAHWLAESLHLALVRDRQGNFVLSRPIPKK